MKKYILTLAVFVASAINVHAQNILIGQEATQEEIFTRSINDISYDIDVLIKKNKDLLKEELKAIDAKVELGELSKEQADKQKNERAEFYAKKIEQEAEEKEQAIKKLINNKIENNISFSSNMSEYQKKLVEPKTLAMVELNFGHTLMNMNSSIRNEVYKSSFISSFGVGFGAKTRLGSKESPWSMRYDLGYLIHMQKINNAKTVGIVDGVTQIVDSNYPLKKSNMNIMDIRLSNYIEYDFASKKFDDFGNRIIKSRQGFYAGLGGFIGYVPNLSLGMQYSENGEDYTLNKTGKYNVNHFTYGVGAYVGYQGLSLRATYNFNEVFKKSFAPQNTFNVSLVLTLM